MNPGRAPVRRNPLAIYLLGLCVLAGIVNLAGWGRPDEIQAALPGWLSTAWAALLVTGSGLALAGILWRATPAALIAECVGMCALAGAAAGYAAALILVGLAVGAGPAAGLSAGTVAAFGVACWARAWQILAPVLAARRALRRGGTR